MKYNKTNLVYLITIIILFYIFCKKPLRKCELCKLSISRKRAFSFHYFMSEMLYFKLLNPSTHELCTWMHDNVHGTEEKHAHVHTSWYDNVAHKKITHRYKQVYTNYPSRTSWTFTWHMYTPREIILIRSVKS